MTSIYITAVDLGRDDLDIRERRRRQALRARDPRQDQDTRRAALAELRSILKLDRSHPIGEAADWTLDQVRDAVQVYTDAHPAYVRDHEIPEPWRTRFLHASASSTRFARGWYAADWQNFLDLWPREHADLEDEHEC
jgi:transposase